MLHASKQSRLQRPDGRHGAARASGNQPRAGEASIGSAQTLVERILPNPVHCPFIWKWNAMTRLDLREQAFFGNVAKAKTVKTILQQCYGDKSAVTDELVRGASAMQNLEDLMHAWQPLRGAQFVAGFMAVPGAGSIIQL